MAHTHLGFNMTKWLCALALSLFAFGGFAAEETPKSCPFSVGELENGMENRVLYTTEAGFRNVGGQSSVYGVNVAITLREVLNVGWTCATWDVRFLLPVGSVKYVPSGGAHALTGLTRESVAEFHVGFPNLAYPTDGVTPTPSTWIHGNAGYTFRAVLVVQVKNGGDNAITVEGKTSGTGEWHFPVDLVIQR